MVRLRTVIEGVLKGGCVLAAAAGAMPAAAQDPAPSASAIPADTSPNAMTNLIRLLVQQRVITPEAGQALMVQAETEAKAAQAKLAAAAAAAPPGPGTVRVPYIPQVVKDEIRNELRGEVMREAKEARWVTGKLPAWLDGLRIYGDMRFRTQADLLSDTNSAGLIDYARFNARGPTDALAAFTTQSLPLLNTRTDRLGRLSVRARLGVEAEVVPGFALGARLASGGDNGPISTTQILGGGFGKKDVWLDLAYLRARPVDFAEITVGRMINPFRTSDIVFDEDLNFDGVAVSVDSTPWTGSDLAFKVTGGVFPFEYLNDDAGSLGGEYLPDPKPGQARRSQKDKYIFGGQLTARWDNGDNLHATASVGYFDFRHVRGRFSQPCYVYLGATACSTDYTRPAFLGKGNTLIALRNIVPDPNNLELYARPQFAGLAFNYRVLQADADMFLNVADSVRVGVGGTFIKNLAFRRKDLCNNGGLVLTNATAVPVLIPGSSDPVGNDNPCTPLDNSTSYHGGPLLAKSTSGSVGWMLRASVGAPELRRRDQWSFSGGYKRIESDAMLDSLVDSDFHLGGTNTKGYFLSGSYMLFDNIRLTARYMSANEITGPALGIDVLQFDIVAGF